LIEGRNVSRICYAIDMGKADLNECSVETEIEVETRQKIAKPKKPKSLASLFPNGRKCLEDGLSALLIGPHGAGKTETVIQLAKEAGVKLKIFNCATLDPYIDLIGVPRPAEQSDGSFELDLVRAGVLKDVQVIFFDEINRAPLATRNAVFEIIQFGSLNGEKLPKLRCCWAAMNPPDDEAGYQVEEIDPALLDRFDVFPVFKPKPSVAYMSQHMRGSTARALHSWWSEQNQTKRGTSSYISPRRLTKLGIVYESLGARALSQSMPPGGRYDTRKLTEMIEDAENPQASIERAKKLVAAEERKAAKIAAEFSSGNFKFTKKGILTNRSEILAYLDANPGNNEVESKLVKALESGVAPHKLIDPNHYAPILEKMSRPRVEALFGSFASAKRTQLRYYFDHGAQYTGWRSGKNAKIAQRIKKECPQLSAVMKTFASGGPYSLP